MNGGCLNTILLSAHVALSSSPVSQTRGQFEAIQENYQEVSIQYIFLSELINFSFFLKEVNYSWYKRN